jgi:crotonobetaine/carnitine-CoA ligase
MDERTTRPWGRRDETIAEQLVQRARRDPDFVYCRFGETALTIGDLAEQVERFARGLAALGIRSGDRVAVMLPNHPDYVVVFLALVRLGACQIPVNVHLRGAGLQYLIEHSAPRAAIVDQRYEEQIAPALARTPLELVVRRGGGAFKAARLVDFDDVATAAPVRLPDPARDPEQTLSIMYTSGTTGMPKGVMLTDRMLRVSAHAAALLADIASGDTLFLWEPLYHIGGCEVMVLGVMEPVTIGMVERFSVSQFWDQVRRLGASHVHFFGGVLALLLKEPERPDDRDHPVRIAWGGGCPATIWDRFQRRFGVRIREAYGMTEASSFTTINTDEKVGSVGRPLSWFDVRIGGEDGHAAPAGQRGEIWVREKMPGLIMRGYFRNPEATEAALQNSWLRTGDIGWLDEEGFLFYAGRKKDSIRRRGENVAAFEIERVANEHPDVAESAAIGVPNEVADEDIKIFLRPRDGRRPDPAEFVRWCAAQMARFQVPRYVTVIDQFPKTPTERIRKELLPRDTEGCFDAESTRR